MTSPLILIKFVAYIALCVAVVGGITGIAYAILMTLWKRGYENE